MSLPDPEAGALLGAGSVHDVAAELDRSADDGLEIVDAEDAEEPRVIAAARYDRRIGTLLAQSICVVFSMSPPDR